MCARLSGDKREEMNVEGRDLNDLIFFCHNKSEIVQLYIFKQLKGFTDFKLYVLFHFLTHILIFKINTINWHETEI